MAMIRPITPLASPHTDQRRAATAAEAVRDQEGGRAREQHADQHRRDDRLEDQRRADERPRVSLVGKSTAMDVLPAVWPVEAAPRKKRKANSAATEAAKGGAGAAR